MDQGGWYDRKDNKHPFRQIEDCMVICAMGPPGGGKSFITPRFQRHFNLVGFANFEDSMMKQIFFAFLLVATLKLACGGNINLVNYLKFE